MTTPSGDEPDSSDGEPQTPSEAPFDPYRFGKPDHPIPPEYAPPGYVPDPVPPQTYQPYQPYQPYGQYGPQGQPPPPPGYHGYGQPRTGNGKAIASMVLGIMSILLCWLSVLDGVVIVTAVVFGILGLTEARQRNGEGRGMAVAGLACAAVGTVAAVLLTVIFVHVAGQCGGLDSTSDAGFQHCLQQHV